MKADQEIAALANTIWTWGERRNATIKLCGAADKGILERHKGATHASVQWWRAGLIVTVKIHKVDDTRTPRQVLDLASYTIKVGLA